MTNPKSKYDVIVIGGGHNGLVCASYLAKAGRSVLVLEANEAIGGASVTRKFSDYFSVSACAHWLYQLNPKVVADLELQKHGMELASRDLDTIALSDDGKHITFKGENVEGEILSEADILSYQRFSRQMLKFSKLLASAFERRPPKLIKKNFTDLITLAKLAVGIKMLGKEDMRDLLRVALINIYDVMEENFECELLKGAISLDSVLGTHMGPRSPNTVFSYLYHRLGEIYGYHGPAVVKGGMGGVAAALVNSAQSRGVSVLTNNRVKKINLELDRATGVTIESGESIAANIIVSNADPKTTYQSLLGFQNLEAGVVRRISNMRMAGDAAKLHLALKTLPEFTGLTEKQSGQRLIIAPSMDYVEEAFNFSKYGEYSQAPALDISIPTIHDNSLAPEGMHVLSAIVQFAPHELKVGWEAGKEPFKDIVIDRIEKYAPGIRELIIESELLTPLDLENEFNISGGHWHHGEISLDQIMMTRPFPGATQYATAIDGLFLCGAGTHPGGGVMGLCGFNAAREIIKRGKKA